MPRKANGISLNVSSFHWGASWDDVSVPTSCTYTNSNEFKIRSGDLFIRGTSLNVENLIIVLHVIHFISF